MTSIWAYLFLFYLFIYPLFNQESLVEAFVDACGFMIENV